MIEDLIEYIMRDAGCNHDKAVDCAYAIEETLSDLIYDYFHGGLK